MWVTHGDFQATYGRPLARVVRLAARQRACFANFGNARHPGFPKATGPALRRSGITALLIAASVVAQAADVIKGSELYRQHCASCHGNNGRPQMIGAPDFSQPTALLKPDMTLLQSIRTGKGAMPAYQGLLRDRELLDIVAHLRTLR
jgi:cytochrome c6